MKKRQRDAQKSKLYTAEDEALKPLETSIRTVQEVEAYLSSVCSKIPLVRRYGMAISLDISPITVADGRGTRIASAHGGQKINLPLWARKDWVILHELTHIIHSRIQKPGMAVVAKSGSRTMELGKSEIDKPAAASHGWQYAAIYLDLIRFCMGKEAHDALILAFKKHRVRYKPKREVSVTEEMRDKLKGARETREQGRGNKQPLHS